jgi:pyridinium-3,5-biscarboxylic acid mononucleotide sulfurtransferase
VRSVSRDWGLRTFDKPAAACLSSRIAFGIEITAHRLARVERAESALRALLQSSGVRVQNLRVRDLGDRARVEVDAEQVTAVAALPDFRTALSEFDAVEIDPRGFRSGAMNELLAEPERFR